MVIPQTLLIYLYVIQPIYTFFYIMTGIQFLNSRNKKPYVCYDTAQYLILALKDYNYTIQLLCVLQYSYTFT